MTRARNPQLSLWKTCSKCKADKLHTEFNQGGRHVAFSPHCRMCGSSYNTEHRKSLSTGPIRDLIISKHRHMSYQDMEVATGVSARSISAIANGKTRLVRVDIADAIAVGLGSHLSNVYPTH